MTPRVPGGATGSVGPGEQQRAQLEHAQAPALARQRNTETLAMGAASHTSAPPLDEEPVVPHAR
eukprot:13684147-Alexandrium_andersonii.AAC.1